MWYIYTIKYYSAMKKNETSSLATTWMNLDGIMLSEINYTERKKYHLYMKLKNKTKQKQTQAETKPDSCQGEGKGGMSKTDKRD